MKIGKNLNNKIKYLKNVIYYYQKEYIFYSLSKKRKTEIKYYHLKNSPKFFYTLNFLFLKNRIKFLENFLPFSNYLIVKWSFTQFKNQIKNRSFYLRLNNRNFFKVIVCSDFFKKEITRPKTNLLHGSYKKTNLYLKEKKVFSFLSGLSFKIEKFIQKKLE